MRSVSALVLLTIAVGAGTAVYYVPDTDADAALAIGGGRVADATGRVPTSTPVVTAAIPISASSADVATRVYSAQTPLYGATDTPSIPAKIKSVRVAETAIVTGEPIMRAGGAVGQEVRSPSTQPAEPATRADTMRSFALDLHRELKRVGCYSGDVTGEWTAASKKAMRAFLERVNARLPVENPDHILLTLVKGHATEACGQTCSAGQAVDESGRCAARGQLAKASAREPQRTPSSSDRQVVPAAKIAEPTPNRAMLSSSWTTDVAPTTTDLATPMTRLATGVPAPATPAVLPGRMTLGSAPSVSGAAASAAPLTTGSITGSMPYPPTLIQPPRPATNRLAATTRDTPAAVDAELSAIPEPVPAPAVQKGRRGEPGTRSSGADRPTVIYLQPPQQQRQIIIQRSYSGGVSSYMPPTYRSGSNRDWKQTVFNRDQR